MGSPCILWFKFICNHGNMNDNPRKLWVAKQIFKCGVSVEDHDEMCFCYICTADTVARFQMHSDCAKCTESDSL